MSDSQAAPSSAPQADATSAQTDTTTNSQSSAQGSDNAKPAQITDAGEKALKQLFKVKVDGNEMEVDSDELVKGYQLAKASYNKMTEAAKLKKDLESRQERMKREPDKVLRELGMDPLDFAEQYLLRVIEEEKLSPQEKTLREKENRIRELEAEQTKIREAREAEEFNALQSQMAQDLENQFMKTFEKHGMEPDAYTVKRMAEKYYLALEDGITDPDLDLFAELVTEELQTDINKTLKRLPMDKLLRFLGDDVLKHIREADLARLKSPPSASNRPNAPVVPKTNGSKPAPSAEAKAKTIYDFREQLEQIKKQNS